GRAAIRSGQGLSRRSQMATFPGAMPSGVAPDVLCRTPTEETAMPLPPLETTRYEVEDGIATITLHRPEKLNAYNGQMRVELGLLFDETDADDEVKAVIVTGAGRAFCAGADLSSGGDTFDRKAPQNHPYLEKLRVDDVYRDGGGTNTLRIYESLKPVIGAINGPAVGI